MTDDNQIRHQENDILDFMTADRAIELYNQIARNESPALEWKFYGRRKPQMKEAEENKPETLDTNEPRTSENAKDITSNTEFDFDDELNDLPSDTSSNNDSLRLKKRLEPGQEKKINLSDIMSDMMKEKHLDK